MDKYSTKRKVPGKKEYMDIDIDHYIVLGLPTGEQGSKLSEKEITKAYRQKAKQLHPDKRPDDPNAASNFQKLQTSYQILKEEKPRKLFDNLLRAKQQKNKRQSQCDSENNRRKRSDLEERERNEELTAKDRIKEESIARQLKEELRKYREMYNKTGESSRKKQKVGREKSCARDTGMGIDTEKTLKVSWKMGGLEYSEERLRGLFETFGEVKDVMIRKKKSSAFVEMATKEAVVAATGTVCGDLLNSLLAIPLQPSVANAFPSSREPVKSSDGIRLNENLVGSRYQAYEDSVLQKLQKAAERQK